MQIPEYVKIGNLRYQVIMVDEDQQPEKIGRSSVRKQKIFIRKDISLDLQAETFLHEIVHQVLDQRSYFEESGNEKLVDIIATGLIQVLKENNLLTP